MGIFDFSVYYTAGSLTNFLIFSIHKLHTLQMGVVISTYLTCWNNKCRQLRHTVPVSSTARQFHGWQCFSIWNFQCQYECKVHSCFMCKTQVSHRHSKGVAELHSCDRYGSVRAEATFVFRFGLIHQKAQNTQAFITISEIVKYISGANQFEQRTFYLCRDYNASSSMASVLTSVKSLIGGS